MDKIKISTTQFENKSGDKSYNLSVIENLAQKASKEGSSIIAFHECSITGYTFARNLSKEQMLDLSEFIPHGESILKLIEIAKQMLSEGLEISFISRITGLSEDEVVKLKNEIPLH